MFWSSDIFTSKKHGIAICWLAATLGSRGAVKKLTKKDYTAVKIPKACDFLESPPDGPMPLRLTSNLLVGVARVYSQQWSIYFSDVNTVFMAIRKAYGPKSNAADGTSNIDMAVPEARPDAITVAINEDEFGKGPFELSLRVGDHEMDWLAVMEEEFESFQLSSQRESSHQDGTKQAKSPTSHTAGDEQPSAIKSRGDKSMPTKDSITLNERSFLDELPDPWSQHDASLQHDLGAEGALDFGFADDELLLANRRPPSVNMDDVAEEVRRDHAEAARTTRKREPRRIADEKELPMPEEALEEEEQGILEQPRADIEEYNYHPDFMEHDHDHPKPSPLPSPPLEEEHFFFQAEEQKQTWPKKKPKRRRDSNEDRSEESGEGGDEKVQKQKNPRRKRSRFQLLMDKQIELTNAEMRSMIESGNVGNKDVWFENRHKEQDKEKKHFLDSVLNRPVLMKSPKLTKFYETINYRYRWGYIPTQPRRKPPGLNNEQYPDQGGASAVDNVSETFIPLGGTSGHGTSDYQRVDGSAIFQPQGDDYELFADQDIEVGRDRPPTPQSDQRGRGRTSDIFPWHREGRARSHSRTSQQSPATQALGLHEKYGGARSSASFMTLEDQKVIRFGFEHTPEVDRIGQRRISGMSHQGFSPLGDLPMVEGEANSIFFPINDDATRSPMQDDTSSRVAAVREKDSQAFLNYAMDIMKGAQTNHVHFFDLVPPRVSSKSAATRAFYHVLTLANRKIIAPIQEAPYGDIRIGKIG